jgi:WD40 repeat protein
MRTQVGLILSQSVHPSSNLNRLIKLDDAFLAVGHNNGDVGIVRYRTSDKNDLTLSVERIFDKNNYGDGSHTNSIKSLVRAGENLLASGSDDCTIKIWNYITGELVYTFNYDDAENQGHNGSVLSLVSINNKDLIASGSADSTIKIWNVTSGQLVHTFKGHTKSVNVLLLLGKLFF